MGRSTTSSTGSGLFGCISPRTATLAIALLGIIIHLNTYSWLGALSLSLPDVPERAASGPPPGSAAFVPSPEHFAKSAARPDQLIDLNAFAQAATNDINAANPNPANNKNVYLPEWVAEAKAYLKAQGLNFVPTQANGEAEANKSTTTNSKSSEMPAFDATVGYQVMDDGAEDVERMQWDALRLVIGTLRWYILLSVICCCAGVVGVLRSQLLLSRLFVIHSFLDFLLSTLSLFALAIVCTYPSVRAHLCDEFGSGELQAWLSSSKLSKLSSSSGPSNAQALISTSHPSNGLPSSDVTGSASGWDTLLDGVFASENCEESFRSTLVPMLMVFGLFFTAVRLQCFFLVQRFYTTLLRSKVYQYGYATSATPGSVESGNSTPMSQLPGDAAAATGRERRWKDSKLLD